MRHLSDPVVQRRLNVASSTVGGHGGQQTAGGQKPRLQRAAWERVIAFNFFGLVGVI